MRKRKGKIFYGWWVLIACALIQFYFGGTFFRGFTALFNPIAEEFNWSYAVISLAFSFRGFESGIITPVLGFLVDRVGSKRLLLAGSIIMGLGFVLLSRIQSLWAFYAVFLLLGTGFSFTGGVVTMAAVAQWFRKRRTLAMGILTAGFGAAGMLVPAVVWLIDLTRWQEAVLIFAAGSFLVALPLSLLVKRAPIEESQAYDDKVPHGATAPPVTNQTAMGRTREVLKTKSFWLLSLAVMFGALAGQAIMVHQIPHMVDVGITRQTAGLMAIVFSVSDMGARLLIGWLGDIFDKKLTFIIVAFIKAAGVLAFALSSSPAQFVPSMVLLGIGFGGLIPLRPVLQIEFFGMRSFASIQGLMMIFVTVGGILSPPFAGLMFDRFQTYRLAFIILSVVTALAIPTMMLLKRGTHQRSSSQAV
ncbi:MAG: MFS transporter [Chloroflexi bacterium]|nr:MFS transporter [Chloroflexota bacterium]